MLRIAPLVLIVVLCACSQSLQVTQPPTTPTSHITTDTIDFGTDPLWREADTTLWLALPNHSAITSIVISDSNFTLLDTSRVNDSLRISLRFQPQSLANHNAVCLALSKQDTLANLMLLGVGLPFERRVGDSYIFEDSAGLLDSVWVTALPLKFTTYGGSDFDQELRNANLDSNGDWVVMTYPNAYDGANVGYPFVTLPFETRKQRQGADSGYDYEDSWNSSLVGDTSIPISRNQLRAAVITSSYDGAWWPVGHAHADHRNLSWHLITSYCRDIGCMINWDQQYDTWYFLSFNSTHLNSGRLRYHLLRFHLRR